MLGGWKKSYKSHSKLGILRRRFPFLPIAPSHPPFFRIVISPQLESRLSSHLIASPPPPRSSHSAVSQKQFQPRTRGASKALPPHSIFSSLLLPPPPPETYCIAASLFSFCFPICISYSFSLLLSPPPSAFFFLPSSEFSVSPFFFFLFLRGV